MDLRFVITLTEHRFIGFVFAPYLIKVDRKDGKHTIFERVTLLNLDKYENAITPEEQQLVKIIEEYNEQNLHRTFSKKKKEASRDFMATISEELLVTQIRPFIEKRMFRCLDILLFNPVDVYHKVLPKNIYEDDKIEVVEDEGTTVFNFIRTDENLKYFLSIEHKGEELHLMGEEGIIAINDPCCIILQNKMFVFRDIDGKKLQPFFDKEFISIPKSAEKKYLESFVRNAIKKYKVNAEGFNIIDVNTDPIPTLSIEQDLSLRYHFVLKFIYDENSTYYANRKTDQKVTCHYTEDAVTFHRLKRNFQRENDCITTLLSYGLVNREGPYFMPLMKKQADEGVDYDIINWININHSFLEKEGISIAQNKLDKTFYLDDFEVKMEISEKNNDWFDIEASVEFAGFKIPFASFIQNILNGEREYMLPDGKIVVLPVEWFESYRDMLTFSKIENNTIQLDKQHFPLINRKIIGVSSHFKEQLLSLAEKDVQPEEKPVEIDAEMRNYQLEGYSWLYRLYKNGFGGCLADDMGLGKTLQTLTCLQRIINDSCDEASLEESGESSKEQPSLFGGVQLTDKKSSKASLVVVPTSLVHNWKNEANRFAPELKVFSHIGTNRKDLEEVVNNFDLVLTSYGIVRNDLDHFLKYEFLNIVLDESQMIKNPGSKTYQAIMQLRADNRIVLTGTPIENSLTDMWSQINFLNPGLLGNLNFFRSEFQLPIEKNNDEIKQDKLLKLISPFVLRRTKREVEPELPPINEQLIFCDMEEMQEVYYEREKSKARNLVIDKLSKNGYKKSAIVILQSLTKLRQIANHPALIDEDYFAGSGKYDEIKRNLQSLLQEGHKALLFSSFVKHLDLIAKYLDNIGVNYAWLTGKTRDREKEIEKFQNETDCQFFLISLKAGGVGLNLTAAEYVFILDPWWNPAAELQAISRAHRIGQDKNIFVYRFISRNSLEEKILKLQQRKSDLAEVFLNNSLKGISEDQVMELFE